ncbi:MAG: tyrosine-type recombinase/integrase [Cyclobacteriaceae bacterium]
MPRHLPKKRAQLPAPLRPASEILLDYEQWLLTNYGSVGTYRDHAKSFLKRFRTKGSLLSQLDTFAGKKSITGRSILNRFRKFLEEKQINSTENDLKRDTRESRLPIANAYVKLFMATSTDRLKSPKTLSTYATILNNYFKFIGELGHFEKITAERFVFSKGHSPFTSALYGSVLKAFAKWALGYMTTPDEELSIAERKIKMAFGEVSVKSLRDVAMMKSKTSPRKLYYKESLSKRQRDQLMTFCKTSQQKAMIGLMVYNGLRPVEVERLGVNDVDFKKSVIAIWGKGRDQQSKEKIILFKKVASWLKAYLKETKIKKGKFFPGLSYKTLHHTVTQLFAKLKLKFDKKMNHQVYSPHSLRHTCGQLMYDEGVPLEFIQRTLRHTSIESTLVYARKAIEKSYFKQMRHLW